MAIKPSPFSAWVVLSSPAAIGVRFLEDDPVDETALWLKEPSK